MKKEEIHWGDWHRILFGVAPDEFLLEVLIRTVIIYFFLLVTLRFLGKRMGGQLSISELAVMLTLGAIISVPMQAPDRGLLQGILVLICALVFQRGINHLALKSDRIERLTEGRESLLVRDGVMLHKQLIELKISREQLSSVLRGQNIYNLGEVRRAYMEACGLFSVFKYPEARPGLSMLPTDDAAAGKELSVVDQVLVCEQCGNQRETKNEMDVVCDNCGEKKWMPAIIAKKP